MALRPGHVPLSSLPVEGVAALLHNSNLGLYVDGFRHLRVDGDILAVRRAIGSLDCAVCQ